MNFYDAYHYLEDHKIFQGRFLEGLYVEVVKVAPETNCVEDESTKNTKTQIWFEAGPYLAESDCWSHDYDLDCGGDTFEEAIINLSKLVHEKYGDEKIKDISAKFSVREIIF